MPSCADLISNVTAPEAGTVAMTTALRGAGALAALPTHVSVAAVAHLKG
jgi:hypothetical protein